ncbi:hypothetical protein DAT35_03080 [Vitiosangium sp. GDMCC 1.1324]|nr:hypothetical protein DAT35_03080 [Vitiosangium sp. GDMCC 1.1324]
MKEGSQPYRLRRAAGKAQGDELAALTVTEEGRVVLKVGTKNRISVYSRARKNYLDWLEKTHGEQGKAVRAAAETRISRGNQLHHLIPDEVAQMHELVKEALERLESYTIDRGTNILDMPAFKNDGQQIMHLGSHPKYSRFVGSKLDKALREITRDKKIALRSVKPEELNRALMEVEAELRKAIESGNLPDEVLKELLEDGVPVGKKLALLEIRREGESYFA